MGNKLPEKIYAWNYCGSFNTGLGLPVVDMGDTPWAVYTRAPSTEEKPEGKKPDDAEFERALSFFLGSCEAQQVDMWDRFDVIKSYAYGYKKLYWDLLASWADLKIKYGVAQERADLHTDILKQVRDQIEFCKKHDHFFSLDKTMALIDKALGEQNVT